MTFRQLLNSPWVRSAFLMAVLGAVAAPSFAAQVATPAKQPVLVVNPGYRLVIDAEKGTIASLRSTFGIDHDLLIPGHTYLPLFKIEFLDDHAEFKAVTSSEAQKVSVSKRRDQDGETVTIEFKGIAQLPLDARVNIRCPSGETLTYWSLEIDNRTTLWIGHVQFPVIEVPFDTAANRNHSHILYSFADGVLASPVDPSAAVGAWEGSEYDTPEIWRYNNYPGQWTSTQLMAYYNDAGGLYVACDDPKGLPKFIDPLLGKDGVTMGLGHYPGTRGPGETKLPYHVVLGTFHGDWYAAAEIYRDWASKQPFCATKMAQRTDMPKWIADSPPAISFPMRGQGDWDPPAAENPEYTPLTNALPYLDKWAAAFEMPLMPIIFNWEHGGPWVQPDAYPPVGGDASFREFMSKAKARGWHPMIYGDGLCWVTWQKNTNYDGMPYFHSHGGDAVVTRRWDGSMPELDLGDWRKNYMTCVGTERGRQMILDMTRHMAELGPDVVQQFDQGPGPTACYAPNHGHPPVPGPWMAEAFDGLIKADVATARSVNPTVAMSCEGAPPETQLQNFQVWDSRFHTTPLYSFLYHEYANGFQGFYTNRVNDEALRLSVARALVYGYFINFTLRDKGLVEYDWDQTWTRAVPDQAAFIDWTKRVSHFRAGVARNYLVYGRMLRPWTISGVTRRDFGWGPEPLVQSATWQAPDGRIGVVLANYGDLPESPRVELEGQGTKKITIYLDGQKNDQEGELPRAVDIKMEPRSLCLIELP
ncbi:MAG TPA: DUF6259 domain-containing protein [Terriglobia bacterium]|nr:DUF6259 domain-containing protein [Terriglobia bacterium]